jgi:phosphate transport system substrate-binding protein
MISHNLTQKSRRGGGLLALALLTATILYLGCGGGDETAGPDSTVVVDGSSTVFRISDRAREEFLKLEPKVNVVVDKHGTGGGFGRYLKGEVDVIDASRPAKTEEETAAKTQGIEWTRFLVGYDGITVVVNKKNDFVKSLSVSEMKRLFEPGSKVKTWKDLNPAWPDRKIIIYTPDKDSGTFEFFTEKVVGVQGKQRDDVQASPDDNTLVKGVAGDADSIGYFGYAYYAANTEELRALPIQSSDEATAVEPTLETILKKSYSPLSRPLYIYVKKSSLRRPAVASFVKYYVDHVGELAKKAGYVPPTEEDQSVNRMALPAAGRPAA